MAWSVTAAGLLPRRMIWTKVYEWTTQWSDLLEFIVVPVSGDARWVRCSAGSPAAGALARRGDGCVFDSPQRKRASARVRPFMLGEYS